MIKIFFKNIWFWILVFLLLVGAWFVKALFVLSPVDVVKRLTLKLSNNPLALRSTADNWQGKTGSISGFCTFDTLEHGNRAGLLNLVVQMCKHESSNTMLGLFRLYAPSSDGNKPDKYAKFVADGIGVGVSDPVALTTSNLSAIGHLITIMEGIKEQTVDQLHAVIVKYKSDFEKRGVVI